MLGQEDSGWGNCHPKGTTCDIPMALGRAQTPQLAQPANYSLWMHLLPLIQVLTGATRSQIHEEFAPKTQSVEFVGLTSKTQPRKFPAPEPVEKENSPRLCGRKEGGRLNPLIRIRPGKAGVTPAPAATPRSVHWFWELGCPGQHLPNLHPVPACRRGLGVPKCPWNVTQSSGRIPKCRTKLCPSLPGA